MRRPRPAHRRPSTQPESNRAARMHGPKTGHPRIVGVQHRDSIRRQRFDQFALGQRHAFNGIESFDVRVPTLVTTPIRGRAMAAKSRISPA